MMHHSPTFVLYVLNLDQLNPKRIISGYDIRTDIITSMILKDMIISRTSNQRGVGSSTKISSSSRCSMRKDFYYLYNDKAKTIMSKMPWTFGNMKTGIVLDYFLR